MNVVVSHTPMPLCAFFCVPVARYRRENLNMSVCIDSAVGYGVAAKETTWPTPRLLVSISHRLARCSPLDCILLAYLSSFASTKGASKGVEAGENKLTPVISYRIV